MQNESRHSSATPASRQSRAFTLIELPAAIGVISVLIGLLLPAVQKEREAQNETDTQTDLRQIVAAEKTYFRQNSAYADTFSALGLGSSFPNDSAHGFTFQINLIPGVAGGGAGFTAFAVPALPGITGSIDFRTDQAGVIVPFPDAAADAARERVNQDIRDAASQAGGQLASEVQNPDFASVGKLLTNTSQIRQAFNRFASNSSEKVTVNDILNYQGLGATEMSTLLSTIGTDLQFGTAGENFTGISPTFATAMRDARVAPPGKLQVALAGSSFLPGQDSDVARLYGFCDGSVRFSSSYLVRSAAFYTDLTPFQPQSRLYTGPITITDSRGNTLTGLLIGLLLPAVQNPDSQFQGIVIAPEATGQLASGAGFGSFTATFDGALGGSFTGALNLASFQ